MRFALSVLFVLVSTPVLAEWVNIGANDDVIFYIDSATIVKNGDLRDVWQLQDLKQRHNDGEMSRRALQEYDCKEKRYRLLLLADHAGPMASGKILVSSSNPTKWEPVPADTLTDYLLKFVCAK